LRIRGSFAGLEREQVSSDQVRELVAMHFERNLKFYGADDGPRLFRKHAVQYLNLRRLSEDRKDILAAAHPRSSSPLE
jgi:hypothetical protein